MARLDLAGYDGVLAGGEAIRQLYLERGWAARAWTWHEAADTRVFQPAAGDRAGGRPGLDRRLGRGRARRELRDFLLRPARSARLHGHLYGAG